MWSENKTDKILLGRHPNNSRNCWIGISDKTALKKVVGLQKMRLIILSRMEIFHSDE